MGSRRYLGAGTCLWITLCIGLLLFRRRQYTRFLVLLPSCLLLGTLMIAAPAAFVFRYVYFFPLCMPLFLLLPFLPEGRYSRMHWRADTETIPMEQCEIPFMMRKQYFPNRGTEAVMGIRTGKIKTCIRETADYILT